MCTMVVIIANKLEPPHPSFLANNQYRRYICKERSTREKGDEMMMMLPLSCFAYVMRGKRLWTFLLYHLFIPDIPTCFCFSCFRFRAVISLSKLGEIKEFPFVLGWNRRKMIILLHSQSCSSSNSVSTYCCAIFNQPSWTPWLKFWDYIRILPLW